MKVIKLEDLKKQGFKKVAYEGCHKIYLIKDEKDIREAKACGYRIHDIDKLEMLYDVSCSLRFISDWKLTQQIVKQFENVKIEEESKK